MPTVRRATLWVFPLVMLMLACTFPFLPTLSQPPDTGILDVDIQYSDDFYTETFNYSREAENIKHYVLVVPAREADRSGSHAIFSAFYWRESPDDPLLTRDGEDLSWALPYLHDAPEAHFTGEFEPGSYYVAVAFLAGPVSQEEAEVGEDVILYPGVTGGGASTDYQEIVITAGETLELIIPMTDANGWACPWLYVYNGRTFDRVMEILRNVRGKANEQTEISHLGMVQAVNGAITVKIAEEREEMTFIDEFYLLVDGVPVRPTGELSSVEKVAARDQDYLIVTNGQTVTFSFTLPEGTHQIDVVVSGFYLPLEP